MRHLLPVTERERRGTSASKNLLHRLRSSELQTLFVAEGFHWAHGGSLARRENRKDEIDRHGGSADRGRSSRMSGIRNCSSGVLEAALGAHKIEWSGCLQPLADIRMVSSRCFATATFMADSVVTGVYAAGF